MITTHTYKVHVAKAGDSNTHQIADPTTPSGYTKYRSLETADLLDLKA